MLIEEYGIDPNTKIRMQFNDGFPVDAYCRWYLHSEEPVPFETLFYLFEKAAYIKVTVTRAGVICATL